MGFGGVILRVGGTHRREFGPTVGSVVHAPSFVGKRSLGSLGRQLKLIGLTATGTRTEPQLAEVLLPVLLLFDSVIENLLLGCITVAFGLILLLRIFAWSRLDSHWL